MKTIGGRCFCGSIRYELLSEFEDVYYCHCRDCQVMSGSAFRVLGIVRRESLNVLSGDLAEYTHRTHFGSQMTREFCPKCGTPLFIKSTRFPEIKMISVSTLDEPESVKPSFEIWTASKIYWSELGKELKSFPHGALDDLA